MNHRLQKEKENWCCTSKATMDLSRGTDSVNKRFIEQNAKQSYTMTSITPY